MMIRRVIVGTLTCAVLSGCMSLTVTRGPGDGEIRVEYSEFLRVDRGDLEKIIERLRAHPGHPPPILTPKK